MEPINGLSGLKIALLIDFDNVILGVDDPGFDVELVVNALRERGHIVMGRVYGDWYRHNRHRRKLMEQGLELVETPAFGPVIKNSADIRIALDGLEIGMTQSHIDTFCLVSGDSDFLPLIKKLQYLGKTVLVISGNRFTSDMLRRNCNEFISYENLLAQSVGATEDATTLDGAFALLHRAMVALRERGSEIRSSTVKQMMIQLNPVFSERNFGCAQFRQFLDKAVAQNLIKLGSRDKTSGEFLVLSPEEEEAIPEAKIEAKAETPRERAPRHRRGEGKAEAQIAPETQVAPEAVAKTPIASFVEAVVPAATREESFAPAENDEADDHSTTSSALLSRGLRRGKLRFSGKTGRPEKVASSAAASSAPVESEAALPSPESVTEGVEEMPEVATGENLAAVAEEVAKTAAEISVGTLPPEEVEVSPALEAALEEAKKPARRRRTRRKAGEGIAEGGEKGVSQTAPASPEDAARNERDADAAGVTFPGKAFDLTPAEEAPAQEASATEAVPEAAETAASEAEAPKKPARRRRAPRKKATDEAAPEAPDA